MRADVVDLAERLKASLAAAQKGRKAAPAKAKAAKKKKRAAVRRAQGCATRRRTPHFCALDAPAHRTWCTQAPGAPRAPDESLFSEEVPNRPERLDVVADHLDRHRDRDREQHPPHAPHPRPEEQRGKDRDAVHLGDLAEQHRGEHPAFHAS